MIHLNPLRVALSLLVFSIGSASIHASDERDTLDTSRRNYDDTIAQIQTAKQREIESATSDYLKTLDGLLVKCMDEHNLDDAVAVKAEVERVRPNAPVTAEDLKRGLVLHFSFDEENAQGKVADSSGAGNDGQAVGAHWTPDGHHGGGFEFGMTSNYITVPNNRSLNPREITMAAWIKTGYTDAIWRRIFDKGTGRGYVLSMCGDDKGKSFRGEVDIEPGRTWAHTGIHVADGQWHHVVGTFDGEAARVYVDGQPAGPVGRWKGELALTPYDLTIGADRSNPAPNEVDPSFNGTMDDLMMYDRALSAKEVKFLFDSQK